jgi:hypothetical protein
VVGDRVLELARRAADLLPEPPAAHDAFGMLAWEELVLSTARRLQAHLDVATLLAPPTAPTLRRRPASARLDADSLITLAVLLAHTDDATCGDLACAAVLAGEAAFAHLD